jgi:hypothetical protein
MTAWSMPFLGLVLLLWSAGAAAAVTASFDRTQVYDGDTVTLTIEAEGLGGNTPDLSVLDRDFDVLGTSTGSRIQIVNGRQSATRSWRVTLAPKRRGRLKVPPIEVGAERTPALELLVSEMPQTPAGGPGDDLFLEVSVGNDGAPVMVQQQVPLTVRLYTALPLRVGELTEPRPEGAVLERLGEDVLYDTRRNGREYRVVERRFSLSPERSGALRIPPLTFTGELRSAGSPRGFGSDQLAQLFRDPVFERFGSGLFEQGEPVRARSQAITLEVQPQPQEFTGRYWLPARELSIQDSWEREPPSLASGEPASRTLTITASGLSGSQIPEIGVPAPADVRVYPDEVDAETRTDGEQLFGVSRQTVTVMPTRGGTLEFPEIRLRWWDVDAEMEREAVVPARRLESAGPGKGTSEAPARETTTAPANAGADAGGADAGRLPAEQSRRVGPPRRPLGWLLLLALAVGMLTLLWPWRGPISSLGRRLGLSLNAAWAKQRQAGANKIVPAAARLGRRSGTAGERRASPASAAPPAHRAAGNDRLAAVRMACLQDDARGAAAALLAVAPDLWPDASPRSLGGIGARLDADGTPAAKRAAGAVRALEASLYGPAGANWQGETLATSLTAALPASGRAIDRAKVDEPLAPLYPRRG